MSMGQDVVVALGIALVVVLVLTLALTALWRRAVRIDRAHLAVLAARRTLEAQLDRRAAATRSLVATGVLDPSAAVLLADVAHRAADGAVEPVVDDGLDGAVGRTVGDVGQEHRRGGIEHAGGHQGPGGGGAPVELRLESPPRGQHREVGAVDAHGPPPQGRERQREDEDHDERDPERDDDVLPHAHAPSPAVVPGAVPAPTPRTRAARVRGSGRTRVAAVAMTVS